MNLTSDQLAQAGFDIVDGKAVRRGTGFKSIKSITILEPSTPTKPRKYRNEPVKVDGWRFDSRKEAKRYEELKLLKQAGQILWFACQVPFRLPGHTRYIADFVVCWKIAGQVSLAHRTKATAFTVEDVKSPITRKRETYRLKKRMMLEIHSIEIVEV